MQARQRELQEQLAALEGEVQRERQRTEELQNASCVLGAVLQVHEAAFNILRATGGPPAGSRPAGAAPFSSEGGSNTGAAAVNGSAPAPSPAMAALECLPASRDSGASATAALGVASRLMTLPFQQRSEVFCSQLRVSSPDLEGQLRTAPDSFAFDLRRGAASAAAVCGEHLANRAAPLALASLPITHAARYLCATIPHAFLPACRAQRELSRHLDLGDPGLVDGLCSLTPQAVCQASTAGRQPPPPRGWAQAGVPSAAPLGRSTTDRPPTAKRHWLLQDYADFGDYVAATIALLDSGGLAEDEAVERLLPAFQYQARRHQGRSGPGWGPARRMPAARRTKTGACLAAQSLAPSPCRRPPSTRCCSSTTLQPTGSS